MRSHIRLGKVFGIEIGLHYSWILIAVVITASLAGNFRTMHADWTDSVVWASAALTSVLFFLCLLAHELSHALVARAHGLPVRSILLFALGGVAQIDREPDSARAEFLVAIVGPVASVLIGVLCLGGVWAAGTASGDQPTFAVLLWLGYINLSLAAFNMVPGFPLDGGRVLRAIAWWVTGSSARSTRIAAQAGRVVAVLFMAAGVVRFAAGAGLGGLWIAFIGWFLFRAAGSSYTQVRLTELLRGVRVRDLMARDCPHVDAWTNLQTFVDQNRSAAVPFCYIAVSNGQVLGIVSSRDVADVPPPQRMYKTVADVMHPVDETPTISPDMPVADALVAMGSQDVSQLPVAENGQVEGVISRANVLGFLQAHGHLRL